MSKARREVFIIHHYDEEGRERANLLAGILNLLNILTVFGDNLGGQRLSEGVQNRIASSRLVIALLTRDVKVGEDTWHPSQWTQQEVGFAVGCHLPVLVVVEDGVSFDGGIAGDLEQIRFAPGEFASTLVRIANQVQALMLLGTDIPDNLPGPNLSDHVTRLVIEARAHAKKNRWDRVLQVSDEALRLDPSAWQASLSKGVALIHLGQLSSAERLFQRMLEDFASGEGSLLSKVHHNIGLVEEVRDGGSLNPKSLRKQARSLEKSLALDHKNVCTRASLVLCRVALGELDEANALLMDSLKYRDFLKALRRDVETKGAAGHRLLRELPDWLYSLLFPTWHTDDNDNDDDERED